MWFCSSSRGSYARLPQRDPNESPDASRRDILSIRCWLRIYWLTAVLCCGGVLFGYDSGVIGAVLTFDSFRDDFRFEEIEETRVSSIAVGIQQAAALLGCFIVWPLANHFGRRVATVASSFTFCIGVVLEAINVHSMSVFYTGRAICGIGIGASATVIPIYLAEMSPKELRGKLGSCYQLTFTIGILISYWIDYGVKFMPATARQWQIPIALQVIPGALMGLGALTIDESVRWLLWKGYDSHAWRSLVWIRASDSAQIEAEFDDIKRGVDEVRHTTAGFKLYELLERPNAHRLLLGFGIFMSQQSTGSTALAYFGPQLFSVLAGPGDKNLLLTGIFGAVKVVSCALFVAFFADRFGRRPLLMSGAALMSVCMVATATAVKSRPPSADDGAITGVTIGTVALVYADIAIYNFSWGPLPWPYVSEIFPPRIREPGVALAVGSQWFWNLTWSFLTPYVINLIDWATFLLFGLLDLLALIFVYFSVKETSGKTLEEINNMFDPKSPVSQGAVDSTSTQDARPRDTTVDQVTTA